MDKKVESKRHYCTKSHSEKMVELGLDFSLSDAEVYAFDHCTPFPAGVLIKQPVYKLVFFLEPLLHISTSNRLCIT